MPRLSPGQYSNAKYWNVSLSSGRLVIGVDASHWDGMVAVPLFVCVLGMLMVGGFFALSSNGNRTPDLGVLIAMIALVLLVALGCLFLPLAQMKKEEAKGDILVFESDSRLLKLPQQKLSLAQSQIIEFRILAEAPGRNGEIQIQASELRLIYKSTNKRMVTLLRTNGWKSFQDVINAIKELKMGKVVLHEQDFETREWMVRDL